SDFVPGRSRRVLLGDSEVVAEELENRKQRHRLAVGNTMRLVNRNFPCPAALGELVAKAALAGSGLRHDADHLRISGDRLIWGRLKNSHLAMTPDELSEAARTGHVEARAYPAHTLELENVELVTQPLYLRFTEVSECEVTRNEIPRMPT